MSERCKATAKTTGEQCQKDAVEGDDYCAQHGGETCSPENPIESPNDWDRVVDAAAVLVMGESVAKAAELSGAGERTIREWRKCDWWEQAKSQAIHGRLDQIGRFALRTVRDAMRDGEDVRLAWDIVRQLIDEAPDDTQNVDVTSDGEQIEGTSVEQISAMLAGEVVEE